VCVCVCVGVCVLVCVCWCVCVCVCVCVSVKLRSSVWGRTRRSKEEEAAGEERERGVGGVHLNSIDGIQGNYGTLGP